MATLRSSSRPRSVSVSREIHVDVSVGSPSPSEESLRYECRTLSLGSDRDVLRRGQDPVGAENPIHVVEQPQCLAADKGGEHAFLGSCPPSLKTRLTFVHFRHAQEITESSRLRRLSHARSQIGPGSGCRGRSGRGPISPGSSPQGSKPVSNGSQGSPASDPDLTFGSFGKVQVNSSDRDFRHPQGPCGHMSPSRRTRKRHPARASRIHTTVGIASYRMGPRQSLRPDPRG